MFFNSYIFILLFLPITIIGYFSLNHIKKYNLANAFLALMSLWFYGYFNFIYLLVFLASVCVNFYIGRVLYNQSHEKNIANKNYLTIGISLNVLFLFICKYYDFFVDNINIHFNSNIPYLEIALPLGISFYTFQQIAYLIDSYRGETSKYSFIDYLLFVSFFAQLIEGPIVLHDEFFKELNNLDNRVINYENLLKGFYGFSCGLAKKILIADNLSAVVDLGFNNINTLSGTTAFFIMLCYTFQIYFDFSGYCDMAYGIGCMLNLRMPINFNSPYKAVSIADFWDRWHITLTRFFTKYIYIPLGGSRKGKFKTYLNVFIVFLISGIWHGANWNFVVWGIMNGIFMIIYRIGKKYFDTIPSFIMIIVTFIFDIFAWAMFRADNVKQGFAIMKQVFVGGFTRINPAFGECFEEVTEVRFLIHIIPSSIYENIPELFILIFALILLFAVFFLKNTQEKMQVYKPGIKKIGITVLLLTWSIISLSNITDFIYVNF